MTALIAAAPAGRIDSRPLPATRCECRHCHTHALLVRRGIGTTKCRVCHSYDLVPVVG